MSHVPIATPPVWEVIAPSLAAHALEVDVNIIYMGVVIAIQGDCEASIICCLKEKKNTSKEAHDNYIIFMVSNWKNILTAFKGLNAGDLTCVPHHKLAVKYLMVLLHRSSLSHNRMVSPTLRKPLLYRT